MDADDKTKRFARMIPALTGLAAAGLSLQAGAALAQSAAPGAVIVLDEIEIRADTTARRFEATPGAVTLIDRSEAMGEAAPTLADTLSEVPGVVVQEFFGGNDQPRIQIRGSGLQQNPAERGLLILQDGMPVNRADGSYVVGLAAPGQAESIEVFRGAAANRIGANVLGGAINFASPSGATAPGMRLSFGGGSFGRGEVAGSYGIDGERADVLLRFEHAQKDGYRDYNGSRRSAIGGNVTLQTGEAVTRLFFSHTDLEFDVAGPLTWDAIQNDPESNHAGPVIVGGVPVGPGPNVLRDQPRRDTRQTLAGARTTLERGENIYDFGLSLSRTDDSFAFPISAGFRDTEGSDATLTARYSRLGEGELPLFETGLTWSFGKADRDYDHNLGGARGPAFGRNRLTADTLSIFAGANLPWGGFTLSPSIAFNHASRESEDRWTAATRPTVAYSPMNPGMRLPDGAVPATSTSYDRSYSGFTPALALSWAPAEGQFAWISLARGFEPPTHDDLLGTVGGTPNSGPGRPNPADPAAPAAMFATPDLEAQTSITLELGWRGTWQRLSWDATVYHARLKNELLSLRDVTGATLASVNAGRTRHSGVELGLSGELTETLSGRLAWTWQDFRFDDDPLRGDNRIAGAPRNVVTLALDWRPVERLTLRGKLHWVPGKTPVDNMNTVFNDSYALVDLGAEYALTENAAVHVEVTNLTDERYAASTLVLDQAVAGQAAFIPGEGRAFYLGTRLRF
ncbi:TonB-dependent receptor [Paracoccus sp. pheM1]|uniref:TonB-dependent receptor family protein n=1 Tax=Paracoccus sp. pheM1 TaxID=2831675 RepID=UPI001BDB7EA1|nr:TonB-dependent receptor [Paracoccus sp. pheM1]MBT0782143.1 TonB-dependent receptor [Paracoccus sp. pheM1]